MDDADPPEPLTDAVLTDAEIRAEQRADQRRARRKPEAEIRKHNLSIWFNQEEYEAAKATAARESASVSTWARQIVMRELRKTKKGRGK